jgi:hypothetical protein
MLLAAELSIGIRVDGIARLDVQSALWESRSLVKTYGIRGTVHLFPTRELPLWLAALRRRVEVNEEKRLARFGLSRSRIDALVSAIGQALNGAQLTTRQLGDEVARRVGAWAIQTTVPAFGGAFPAWRLALGWAAATGRLCFGPNAGTEATYVRPDQWLGQLSEVDPEKALAEVFRRYLRAYGPVSVKDFAQWFYLPGRDARELAASLKDELVEVDVEGYRAVLLASDVSMPVVSPTDSVHLLPHFDCYVRGLFPRECVVGEWSARTAGGTGTVPLLLVEGRIGGVWKQQVQRGRLEVRVEPFRPLTPMQRDALEREVTRLGEFLTLPASCTLGSVDVRPHL